MQHFVSMLGSLIVIPLVIVPAMGGTQVSDWNSSICSSFHISFVASNYVHIVV